MTRVLRLTGILLVSAGLATPATGQDTPVVWRTQLDLGVNSSSGNSDLTTILGGVALRRLETETLEFQISVNYRYGKSEDRTVADILQQETKLDINPRNDWSPFFFQSVTRNPVRKVSIRANGGIGEKWTFWRSDRGRSSVSLAGIYNFEDLEAVAGSPDPKQEKTVRWSGRFKFDYTLNEQSRVQTVVFYQPVWDTFDDYYVVITNTLVVGISNGLALTVSHDFNHDATPAEGIVRDDAFLSVGFRYVF